MVQDIQGSSPRATEKTIQAIREMRIEKGAIAPLDMIDACAATGTALGIISIKCDHMETGELQRRIEQSLRDTDLIYRTDDVVQVFAPISGQDGLKTLYSRVFPELPNRQQVYLTFLDTPADVLAYGRKGERAELMDLALGSKAKNSQEAHITTNKALSREEVTEYLKLVHAINPSLLGNRVKVIYAKGNGFDYLRGVPHKNDPRDWRMEPKKSPPYDVGDCRMVPGPNIYVLGGREDISHILENSGFIVLAVDDKRRYEFDDETAELSLKGAGSSQNL